MFQQDNARQHVFVIERTFVDTEIVRLSSWSVRLADISPIENFWAMFAERLARHHTSVISVDELWHHAEVAFVSVPVHAIRSLFDSMPRRISVVIATRATSQLLFEGIQQFLNVITILLLNLFAWQDRQLLPSNYNLHQDLAIIPPQLLMKEKNEKTRFENSATPNSLSRCSVFGGNTLGCPCGLKVLSSDNLIGTYLTQSGEEGVQLALWDPNLPLQQKYSPNRAKKIAEKVSDRGPRNLSWQWARGTPVVDLSLEHHTGDLACCEAAHKPFGPTDLTSTYAVCTRRVFGSIEHRTQAVRSGFRCCNH
ncbi:hypothetical protein TNCV_2715061 [Trichonephila clavipes]|nr:hypothetical protein TNCV_2715061 [Trichonephila clavipes]